MCANALWLKINQSVGSGLYIQPANTGSVVGTPENNGNYNWNGKLWVKVVKSGKCDIILISF